MFLNHESELLTRSSVRIKWTVWEAIKSKRLLLTIIVAKLYDLDKVTDVSDLVSSSVMKGALREC